MPKQSGIHQIRGKRGTTCYYFRKGLQVGLQREINQQMSERVKRDPNFANTRLYASEFGYSGHLAALSFVPTEFGLTLNLRANSQGKLTAIYRNLLNEYGTGDFGKRNFIGTNWQPLFVSRINNMCRLNTDTLYPLKCEITLEPLETPKRYKVYCKYTWDNQLVQKMQQYGLKQLNIVVQHFVLCAGHYNAEVGKYINIGHLGGSYSFEYQLPLDYALTHTTYTQTISSAIIDYPTDLAQVIEGGDSILARPVIYIQGVRNIAGLLYPMQNLSTFKMLDNAQMVDNAIDHILYNGIEYSEGDTGPMIDAATSVDLQIVSEYIRQFTMQADWQIFTNGVRLDVLEISDNTIYGSINYTIYGQVLRSVKVTYPDGTSTTLHLN